MIRVSARAAILNNNRLLLVNAYAGASSDLWALPGGGADAHASLLDNLKREIREETGLEVNIGAPIVVSEFHSPEKRFHQIDLIFRATLLDPDQTIRLEDPMAVVNRYRWVTREELATLRHKPDSLAEAVWGQGAAIYDPLELIVS